MSNLMGLLFSFLLIVPTLIFGIDLISISGYKTTLEARATIIAYKISDEGGVKEQLIQDLKNEDIDFVCIQNCGNVFIGNTVVFELIIYYVPLIIPQEIIPITVIRHTIVGYL